MWSFLNPFPFLKTNCNTIISNSFIVSLNCWKWQKRTKKPYAIFLHHPPQFLYFPDKETRKAYMDSPKRKIAAYCSTLAGPFLRYIDRLGVKHAKVIFVNSEYTKRNIEMMRLYVIHLCVTSSNQ